MNNKLHMVPVDVLRRLLEHFEYAIAFNVMRLKGSEVVSFRQVPNIHSEKI